MLILPEIIIVSSAILLLVCDLILGAKRAHWLPATLTSLGLLGAIAAAASLLPDSGSLFGGRFVVDAGSLWFKLLFLLSGLGITLISSVRLKYAAEFYVILLFNLCGMMILISATDLITMYVSLELATIPLFLLSAWSKNSASTEAGIKYVILGALSSALLLYGLSLVYGLTGTTEIAVITQKLSATPILYLAASLLFAGVGFKLALAPFHMWAPDVYEGAPTPVTAYLSVASKGAGLALGFIIFLKLLSPFLDSWDTAFALLAACTMTLGNCVAIWQSNIKRFMAYSSISQAGYLLLGFLGSNPENIPAMLFYLLAYVVTNIAVFSVIILHSDAGDEVKDYAGLSRRNPMIALCMMVALFGLAGIPPLAGFTGKFFLFSIASRQGFHWLVAVAALNSTISLYYYLRIIRNMYIEEPRSDGQAPQPLLIRNKAIVATLCVTTIASVLIGFVPTVFETIHKQTIVVSALWKK